MALESTWSLGDAVLNITGSTAGLNKALGDADSAVKKNMGNILGRARMVGVAMTAMGAGILGGLGMAVKAAGDFENEITKAFAIMGPLTDEQKKKMSEFAQQLSGESTFSIQEVAKAFFYLASAGLTAEETVKMLPQILKFAEAGNFDLAKAVSLSMNAVWALGLKSKDTQETLDGLTRVTNVLAKANILANADIQQFSEALTNNVAGALRMVGKDIEEGAAVLTVFAQGGLVGAAAGTALTIVMRDLQLRGLAGIKDDGPKAATAIIKLSEKLERLQTDLSIANQRMQELSRSGKTSQSTMMGQAAKIADLSDKIKNTKEKLGELTDGNLQSTNTWKEHKIAVFDAEGEFRNMADVIGELERAMNDMSDAQRKQFMKQLGFQEKSVHYLQTLIGTSERIRENEAALRNLSGVVDEIAEKQLATFNSQMKMLGNQMTNLKIGIGTQLLPVLKSMIAHIKPILEKWADWIKANPELTEKLVFTTAAIGGLAIVLGPVLMSLGSILTMFTTGAVLVKGFGTAIASLFGVGTVGAGAAGLLGIAAVLGALVGAGGLLVHFNDTVYEFINNIAPDWAIALDTIGGTLEDIWNWFDKITDKMAEATAGMLHWFDSTFGKDFKAPSPFSPISFISPARSMRFTPTASNIANNQSINNSRLSVNIYPQRAGDVSEAQARAIMQRFVGAARRAS